MKRLIFLHTQATCKGFENMGTTGPHVNIIIDKANKTAEVRGIMRMAHVKDCINFLFPWFKATLSEPITKPIHFLDGPFTFKRIDSKSAVLEMPEHGAKQLGMILS
jgi:hypothetical protein